MKKITPFFITLLLLFFSHSAVSQSIVINEILTSNTTINQDEDGTYQDWVELYNTGAVSVNLLGFGLTDDAALPYKWTFPNVSLGAGQYLLVYCDDKNRATPGSPLHTNFKISSSGEVITLTNASAVAINTVPATVIAQNISYGRLPNGTGNFTFFAAVTPGAVNSTTGYSEVLPVPAFSHESGFLTAGFNLSITTTVPGASIIYTLDGSEPSSTNLTGTTYHYKNQYPLLPGQFTGSLLNKTFQSHTYSAPLAIADRSALPNKIAAISTTYDFTPAYIPANPIFKGTVVRAKVVKPGALDSKIITKTFYISPQGTSRFALPVASISIDENKLFDYNDGIMVAGVDFDNWRLAHLTEAAPSEGDIANFMRHGRENERPVNFTYFINGAEVLNQDVGMRIHGGSSRTYQDKSLTLYSRTDYGDDTMSYKFFADQTYDNFKGLVMHNSGNDFDQTMFRDAFCHGLSKNLHFTTKGYQPTTVFLNGEYWGMLSFRDKIDDDYFERVYNIAKTDIQVLENEYWLVENDGFADYTQIVDYVTNN
ncbi:MAG TPA: lamin tail domain-containing protein, partial [Flavobacterium sp.]|nr:lamin tail domain-containing protein [Flavobacterium sp.]